MTVREYREFLQSRRKVRAQLLIRKPCINIRFCKTIHCVFELNGFRDAVALENDSSVYGVKLSPMNCILKKHGFSSVTNGTLRGISGATQAFDIIARKGSETIAVDVLPSGDRMKSEMKLINMRAKIWDCAPDLAIAIAPVQATKELREMALNYKLVLIEAGNEQELEEKFEQLVVSLV